MNCMPAAGRVKKVVLLASLLVLASCATTGGDSSEDRLRERATARWEALLGGDLAGAYEYLSPGFRSSVSSLQYQRSLLLKRVAWKSAEYVGSECQEDACKVSILLGYAVYGALPGVKSFEDEDTIEESWIFTGGQWYFVPNE